MNPLRYMWARSLECFLFGVRGYQRRWPVLSLGPGWPVFTAAEGGVALTIDDGPDPRWTPALLDVLAKHDVKATFFLIGARTAEHPKLAARIAAAGHTVGNHSMLHPQPFAALRPAAIRSEIGQAQDLIAEATGAAPKLFRAPGGGWSPSVLAIATQHGLTPVDWTVNTSDWKEPGVPHITHALSRSGPKHVVLCHDGGGDRSQTITAIDHMLPVFKQRGLPLVPVQAV